MRRRLVLFVLTAGALGAATTITGWAQPPHAGHGTPTGWKFAWPEGDAVAGREVFVKLKCYTCHRVLGHDFPPEGNENLGPELSAMGPLHDELYFAETILNPSATIEKGKGYEAPDGSSKMPSFNDSMTVQELIDLVAFLRGLRPPAGAPAPAGDGHAH
ncbi:MAG: c-type cytochrome [Candidatus Rokubacteria bacterium]|nr:c-type cytochrome [Candidatus Rokubacteria bacterium]MBI4592797.1 c-type cytochrome [Candidatus Rokubacteria bacterium]